MFQLPDWPQWAIRTFVVMLGLVLMVASASTVLSGKEDKENKAKPSGDDVGRFRKFQRQFLIVYVIIMTADWLQGTNMYTLYSSYNVSISTLFLTGFTSSAIFGTIVGLYVDKWGRKFGCIVYLVIEVVVNIFEHFNNFPLLMLGRVLGGISTSLLFSAFETWMVTEHRKRKFNEEWLADTFSTMSFLNGISAIISGLVAQVLADQLGEIGPFQAAIALTVLAGFFVMSWDENYGSDDKSEDGGSSGGGMALIMNDKKVMLVGVVNSIFEGSMYSFVFMWVPTLISVLGVFPPTGLVFASLMCCISLGGLLFSPSLLLRRFSPEGVGVIAFLIGAVALSIPVFRSDLLSVIVAFLVFETCVGIFFPCMGLLRSKVIPDSVQGTVMNIFRVPLNMLVVTGTFLTDYYHFSTVFAIITVWMLVGAGFQVMFCRALAASKQGSTKSA